MTIRCGQCKCLLLASHLSVPHQGGTCQDDYFSIMATNAQIVGKVSPWIRPDSHNQVLRRDSEAALRQELEWAAHLGLQACILPIPPSLANSNYARVLNQVSVHQAVTCSQSAGCCVIHFSPRLPDLGHALRQSRSTSATSE